MLGTHDAIHEESSSRTRQATTSDTTILDIAEHSLAKEEVLGSALCGD